MIGKYRCQMWKYCFVILFIGYFSSTHFFSHAHFAKKNIIVHSHPFEQGKEGIPLHDHSDKEYVLIEFLAVFYSSALLLIFTFLFIRFPEKISFPLHPVHIEIKNYCLFKPLRGPPMITILF